MPKPILSPAGYTPEFAMAFANQSGSSQQVSSGAPLPVTFATPAGPPPMSGKATLDKRAGPFLPRPGRAVMLVLSGTWQGTVRLLRSTDGGATTFGLTAAGLPYGEYSTNICEPVWEEAEEGAALYLDMKVTSGSISYRLGQ
ncbi:hypothetical protein RM533_05950 [Croceicoccus sp. F390]|uniref:Uncharacterized protein n=1 Tax=Croceicoccus esteveae TaxID=3075597 RepID=A0ABU2ZGK6_9SPHN|nr:hypothetical protein [Croceicoccus sp. F390]MDT0575723.1 hypothetical protein [Croceicoccus sp. F390]